MAPISQARILFYNILTLLETRKFVES